MCRGRIGAGEGRIVCKSACSSLTLSLSTSRSLDSAASAQQRKLAESLWELRKGTYAEDGWHSAALILS